MSEPARRLLTVDDLTSVIGYAGLVAMGRFLNSGVTITGLSLLASGMLAIFWLVSGRIRDRTDYPNARVAFWALVAVVSGLFFLRA